MVSPVPHLFCHPERSAAESKDLRVVILARVGNQESQSDQAPCPIHFAHFAIRGPQRQVLVVGVMKWVGNHEFRSGGNPPTC